MPATKTRKTRRAPGSKSAKFTEQRRAEVAALRDRLGEFTPDQAAMITMALIEKSGYSSRNASLVAMQMPGATDIAGYRDWQSRGRQVRKGETAIAILAPAGSFMVKDESDPDADGTERMRFRIARVFDVSQTMSLEEGAAEIAAQDAAELAA